MSSRMAQARPAEEALLGSWSINAAPPKVGFFRWVVIVLMGLGGVLVIWTRTAQSVAILKWQDECNWSDAQKQLQLSAFFYGYVGSMWAGPILSTRLGGKHAFGAVTFFAVISQALGPLAHCNPVAAGAARVLVGIFEGPFYPCAAYVISRWMDETGYSRAQLIMTIGATAGQLVGFPISSTMCNKMGWRWAYYLPALMGPCWLVLWLLVASSTPADSSWIGAGERRYLAVAVRSSSDEKQGTASTLRVKPLALMVNAPVLAVTLCNFASAWASYTLMTELPTYLEDQGFNLKQAGIWSDIPTMGPLLIGIPVAWLTDTLIAKKCTATINIRKGINILALAGQGGALVLISLLPTVAFFAGSGSGDSSNSGRHMSPVVVRISVVLLGIAVGCGACLGSASIANVYDIAPSTAGHVTSFFNCLSNVAGIIVPPATGLIQQHLGWNWVWRIAAAISFAAMLIWHLAGTGEVIEDRWIVPGRRKATE